MQQAEDDTALAGADGKQAAQLLRASVKQGAALLGTIGKTAVKRFLADPQRTILFNDVERMELAEALAATNATAELLGRARIRRRLAQAQKNAQTFAEDATDFSCFADRILHPLSPWRALEWFKQLIPGLYPHSQGFDERQQRKGFTLAVTTEKTLLGKVKELINQALASGRRIRRTPADIGQLLDDAGITPKNPQYAEMCFRTNMMSAYNEGSHAEMQEPDVAAHFPVWRYVGIRDGRQGRDHEPKFDKYYPNGMNFADVRGPRVYNCRCTSIPIYKREWRRLQDQGAQIERFAEQRGERDEAWQLGQQFLHEIYGESWQSFCQQGANSGKPGPCPEPEKSSRLRGWLAKAKQIPGRVLQAARNKVAAHYQRLKARYGKRYALAILAAAAAGAPLPLPGASLATAAPIIAIAELHRLLTRPATAHAEHDVSEESRDASGRWTAGGSTGKKSKTSKEPRETPSAKAKPKATRGEMTDVRREGKGKDARLVLPDGAPAPSHIKPGMVPPQWTDVRVSLDPNADVLVQAKDKKGNAKTVYSDGWNMKAQAAKFARIHDALHEMPHMAEQVQHDRRDPKKAGVADCTWLMQEQGTRPGSEADNKGVSALFGHKIRSSNVTVSEPDKNGVPKVALKVNGKDVPIKDKKARAEIARRVKAGEPLHDSTFWLKSHGATTLEGRHVVQGKDGVRLQFMGKESVWHDHLIRDPKLAAMLLERKKAAGDGGKLFGVSNSQVSAYAKTLDHGGFSPKDWRTAKATRMAIDEINSTEAPKDEKDYKAKVMDVARKVSGVLGNEPLQALESYISPTVFSGWRTSVA